MQIETCGLSKKTRKKNTANSLEMNKKGSDTLYKRGIYLRKTGTLYFSISWRLERDNRLPWASMMFSWMLGMSQLFNMLT